MKEVAIFEILRRENERANRWLKTERGGYAKEKRMRHDTTFQLQKMVEVVHSKLKTQTEEASEVQK